jgi:putative transposase
MAASSWMTCVSRWAGGWRLAVVKRSDTQPRSTFAVQPHRWVVERTFCRWDGLRRLSRDYDHQVESSEALIYAGTSHLLLRRLTCASARSSPAR